MDIKESMNYESIEFKLYSVPMNCSVGSIYRFDHMHIMFDIDVLKTCDP